MRLGCIVDDRRHGGTSFECSNSLVVPGSQTRYRCVVEGEVVGRDGIFDLESSSVAIKWCEQVSFASLPRYWDHELTCDQILERSPETAQHCIQRVSFLRRDPV